MAQLKVWNGSAWSHPKAVKTWDGSAWVPRNGYYWDGSAWVKFTFNDNWVARASVATRWGAGADVIADKIYLAGGIGANGYSLGDFYCYDPTTNSWTQKAYLPEDRGFPAVAQSGGKLYCAGGIRVVYGGYYYTYGTLYCYDPSNNSWTQKRSMNQYRGHACAAVVNNLIYVIGGYFYNDELGSSVTVLRDNEVYDPATDSWTYKAAMPTARRGAVAVVVDNIIYVIGGLDSNGYASAKVEAYNPVTNSWSTKAPMPAAKVAPGAGVMDGIIYVWCGDPVGDRSKTNTVYAYDPATNIWTQMGNCPLSVLAPAYATITSRREIYTMGGETYNYTVIGSVYAYGPGQ